MFLRVDDDLFVNVNNIGSIKLTEDADSYKLYITGVNGNLLHNVIYLKEDARQVRLLIEVNEYITHNTVNPEVVIPLKQTSNEPQESHTEQLSLFDMEETDE